MIQASGQLGTTVVMNYAFQMNPPSAIAERTLTRIKTALGVRVWGKSEKQFGEIPRWLGDYLGILPAQHASTIQRAGWDTSPHCMRRAKRVLVTGCSEKNLWFSAVFLVIPSKWLALDCAETSAETIESPSRRA